MSLWVGYDNPAEYKTDLVDQPLERTGAGQSRKLVKTIKMISNGIGSLTYFSPVVSVEVDSPLGATFNKA